MNIFFLSYDPRKAAQEHCSPHVIKMQLESFQMLSTAHRVLDGTPTKVLIKQKLKTYNLLPGEYVNPDGEMINRRCYKSTHANHPSAIWARQTKENYSWLYQLAIELDLERQFRYSPGFGKAVLEIGHFLKQYPKNIPDGPLTEIPQCMPEELRVPGDPISAYRAFYMRDKRHFAKWGKRAVPKWFE